MFEKIEYIKLNARQKEAYNFQKVSAILADYGYITIKLSDDWNGVDFIAQSMRSPDFIKIQLKGRMTIDKKYIKKEIHICFRVDNDFYLIPHDFLLNELTSNGTLKESLSWEKGTYSFKKPSKKHLEFIKPFKLNNF